MDNFLIIVAVVAVFLIFKKMTAPKVDTISGSEINGLLNDKSVKRQFIDVRTAGEFNSNKIKGFKNIPLQTISKRLAEISKETPIVLICASGHRSMQAAKVLKKAGYDNIINVKGGMSSYKK